MLTIFDAIRVNPGIKVGYAAIDLDGKLVSAGVEKEASDEKIVGIISKLGIPSLVATDVYPASSFVQKVAARFNVKVHSPNKSMTTEEKRIIGEDIMNRQISKKDLWSINLIADLSDPHMRDAYAAAIKAYNKHANRLRQVDKLDSEDKLKLKHLIIQGQPLTKMIRGEEPKLKSKSSRTKKTRK
ncbi:MAG: DUF460 domain-containing protein [Candidatus Micrarchaeota archaeon]|nr:DUF460 domain-containing protein [Candidatus Micrarchaeota archaeon]